MVALSLIDSSPLWQKQIRLREGVHDSILLSQHVEKG
jgi:hypothetical protein